MVVAKECTGKERSLLVLDSEGIICGGMARDVHFDAPKRGGWVDTRRARKRRLLGCGANRELMEEGSVLVAVTAFEITFETHLSLSAPGLHEAQSDPPCGRCAARKFCNGNAPLARVNERPETGCGGGTVVKILYVTGSGTDSVAPARLHTEGAAALAARVSVRGESSPNSAGAS